MKNIKLAIAFMALFIFTACLDDEVKKEKLTEVKKDKYGIPWEIDLESAFSKAKRENREVIVMAVSKGCSWCRKMKSGTLSNPKVAKRLQKYILVQADRETPEERKQLPPFKHVPVLFFMTSNKELIDNMRGYYLPEDFLDYLNEIEE